MRRLAARRLAAEDAAVEDDGEPPVERDEESAIILALMRIEAKLDEIRRALLEDGEEAPEH
jgi:hypothetical protein